MPITPVRIDSRKISMPRYNIKKDIGADDVLYIYSRVSKLQIHCTALARYRLPEKTYLHIGSVLALEINVCSHSVRSFFGTIE